MNKRIEEFAAQCGFRSNPNIYDRNQSFDIAKFAELIVRECGNIAFEHWALTHDTSPQEVILRHFGIKE